MTHMTMTSCGALLLSCFWFREWPLLPLPNTMTTSDLHPRGR